MALPSVTEDEMIDRFRRGLYNQDLREKCFSQAFDTFEGLVSFACRIEAAKQQARVNASYGGGTRASYQAPRHGGAQPMEIGNVTTGPRLTADQRKEFMAKGLCFYCKGRGHLARDCPERKKVPGNGRSRQ